MNIGILPPSGYPMRSIFAHIFCSVCWSALKQEHCSAAS